MTASSQTTSVFLPPPASRCYIILALTNYLLLAHHYDFFLHILELRMVKLFVGGLNELEVDSPNYITSQGWKL